MGALSSSPVRIAFTTFAAEPELQAEDREIARLLAKHNVRVDAVVWDDEEVDWSAYRAVVPRSPWDYYRKPDRFRAWLDRMDALGVTLLNDTRTIRANLDKRYLQNFERDGFPIVPTIWANTHVHLNTVRDTTGWTYLIVKPVISAGAYLTVVVPPDEDGTEALRAIGTDAPVMVQPFISTIKEAGEWSLIYFDGEFSHAVCKRPKSGDFRVQARHGGITQTETPRPEWVALGTSILESLPTLPLYARLDGLVYNGKWVVIELELIEPCLFTDFHPQAPQRFVDALLARLG